MNFFYWVKIKFIYFYWLCFPNKKLQTIQKFSTVEYDSCWQLLNAIPYIDDPKIRARLFYNALEELNHGKLFEQVHNLLSKKKFAVEIPARKPLLLTNNENEFREFLVYFYFGENLAYEKFKILSKACDDPLKKVFEKIVSDESEHGPSMMEFLVARSIVPSEIKKRLFANRLLLMKENTVQFFKKFDVPIFIVLTILYFLFGFFLYKSLKKRFYLDRDTQLDIFKNQISMHAQSIKSI